MQILEDIQFWQLYLPYVLESSEDPAHTTYTLFAI